MKDAESKYNFDKKSIHEGYIEIQGSRVWHKLTGRQGSTPLLFVHGGPGAPHDYLEPLESLGNDRLLLFYDQSGCGHSDQNQNLSVLSLDYYINELADIQGIIPDDNYFLVGQSWGALLSTAFLLKHPNEPVKGLILLAPCLSAPAWIEDAHRLIEKLPSHHREAIKHCEEIQKYDSAEYEEAMNAYYHKHLCNLNPWPDCLNRTLTNFSQRIYQHLWGASEFTANGILKDTDLTPHLHKIECPVLLICGEEDEATPETNFEISKLFKDCQFHVIKGATHCFHIEKPDETVAIIRDFLHTCEHPNRNNSPRAEISI